MQVLCASNATHDKVDPITPPEGAAIGERITFEGFPGEPEAQLNPRKKVFEKLAPDLTTNAGEGTCSSPLCLPLDGALSMTDEIRSACAPENPAS